MTDPLAEAIEGAARQALASYDFSEHTAFSPLSESENKVFLIDDPEIPESYVMRVNSGRLTYHNPPSVASELQWLMALERETDILVPQVKPARDGGLVQKLAAPGLDQPRCAAVYSFLPGSEPPEDDLLTGFKRLGGISAQLHTHAKAWTPPESFRRHEWTPEAILDDQLNWGRWQDGIDITEDCAALFDRVDRVLRRRLNALGRDRERFGLIHADLRLANLLVHDDTTAIIDFDDCGQGWYLFDLAGALSFLEERDDVPELIAAWLDGYGQVASILEDMAAEIPSFIMLRRLQLLGWLGYQQYHLEFARQIGPDFTRDSGRLAETYLQAFE